MQFVYPGDDGSRIVSWFKMHLRAVATCANSGLPEASLTLLYVGIDTLGWLAASPERDDAKAAFMDWCEKYLLRRLRSIEGQPLTALDLYAAPCGVLHTSSPVSKLGREGDAHEVWYEFRGRAGFNLMANVKLQPIVLDIERFAVAFQEGSVAFITDLQRDQTRFQAAEGRAGNFFRWGTLN